MTYSATFDLRSAEDTHRLALALADQLQAGDLLVLTGQLGAGKTTLTQSLGQGLGVRPGIISPTFVLSRIHPNLAKGPRPAGPDLVHVDAYRLSSAQEIDDLDLEYTLERAVTVVEWGKGKVEHLTESRLELELIRSQSGSHPAENQPESEPRQLHLYAYGPRWNAAAWQQLLQQVSAALAQADPGQKPVD